MKTILAFLFLTSTALAAPPTKEEIAADLDAVRAKIEALPFIITPKANALADVDAAKQQVAGLQKSLLPLTYEGAIILPKHGLKWLKNHQWIAGVPGQETQIYASYGLAVGKLQLPAPALGDPKLAPVATWITPPVVVGNEFKALVLSTSGQDWGLLNGIAVRDNRVWLNYGMYYHVIAATYPNFNSVALDLTGETALQDLVEPPTKPHVKNHSGYIAPIPDGWHPTLKFLRGNYWQNGSDGGPRVQAFEPGGTWKWAISHDTAHPVAGWSKQEYRWGAICFESGDQKYVGLITHKGTPPGWYGGGNGLLSDGTTAEGYGGVPDACDSSKNYHSYPYKAQLSIYAWNDFAAVMAGADTWSPVPVETINLSNFVSPNCAKVSGGILVGNRLMVVEYDAVSTAASSVYDKVNLLHCYKRN